MRKGLLAGNWKMHKSKKETKEFFSSFINKLDQFKKDRPLDIEIALFVPYTLLEAALNQNAGNFIKIGSQNIHAESKGAYTGEISANMLKDIGITAALIGHSERRQYNNENNQDISKKIETCLRENITPILCVGETLEQRDRNQTEEVLKTQLQEGLNSISDIKDLVVAYEPVWAIGTGKTATPDMAESAHLYIRNTLMELYRSDVSEKTRILYGGSMKPSNIKELTQNKNIDGGLVGGASLDPDDFYSMYERFHR